MKTYIDATVFMGLHSSDSDIRRACKQFFIDHFDQTIYMNLEQIGLCDDVVWDFDRETQDKYYPFMDRLHTMMHIERIPYAEEDIARAKDMKENELSLMQRLLVAQAVDGMLYSCGRMHVGNPITDGVHISEEGAFPAGLESYYQTSLQLQVDHVEEIIVRKG